MAEVTVCLSEARTCKTLPLMPLLFDRLPCHKDTRYLSGKFGVTMN